MRARIVLAPVVALLTAGCLASKGDIQLLQDNLTSMRAQQGQQLTTQEQARARDDSLMRVRLDSAIVAIRVLNDSLRSLSQRAATYQANSSQSIYEVGQQLITLQNRAGISQRQIQDLAAQLETQRERMVGDSVPGDTSKVSGPGPAQMFTAARDQYNNGAYPTARMAFNALLQQFPDYLGASLTTSYIAETYEKEGNAAAADSVDQLVVQKYPQSPEAPTALYKHGLWLISQGKIADARAALERVVRVYPASDAAGLATDRLSKLPTP